MMGTLTITLPDSPRPLFICWPQVTSDMLLVEVLALPDIVTVGKWPALALFSCNLLDSTPSWAFLTSGRCMRAA